MGVLARAVSCPSKVSLSVVVRKRCGGCGELGHNRRTCTLAEPLVVMCLPCGPKPSPAGRKCGRCGEVGHNRRTCGVARVAPKVKEMTATQLFARLPNYIPYKTEKKDKTPEPLVGLKGCSLFREEREPKSDLSPAEKRAAKALASLL